MRDKSERRESSQRNTATSVLRRLNQCVCQFRHLCKPRQTVIYFFGVAGPGVIGAEVLVGCRWRAVPVVTPALLVARIESEIEVSINMMVETVVALESSVAEPRGPKAV